MKKVLVASKKSLQITCKSQKHVWWVKLNLELTKYVLSILHLDNTDYIIITDHWGGYPFSGRGLRKTPCIWAIFCEKGHGEYSNFY